jgi:ribonuclease HI
MSDSLKKISIYTDGAAEPNPGPGGYGVVLLFGKHRKELSGGFRRTTNNRMELRAAIVGLEALTALCDVTLYSDSKYLVEAMSQGWVEKWRAKEFLKKGVLMTNADLWRRLIELCELHRVRFEWVKGHAGDVENERCDTLAMAALDGENLPPDEGYEEERRFAETIGVQPDDGGISGGVGGRRSGRAKDEPEEGQPCRKCGVPLERRVPKKKGKGEFYYAWYLHCPGCGTNYMLESAKRYD